MRSVPVRNYWQLALPVMQMLYSIPTPPWVRWISPEEHLNGLLLCSMVRENSGLSHQRSMARHYVKQQRYLLGHMVLSLYTPFSVPERPMDKAQHVEHGLA